MYQKGNKEKVTPGLSPSAFVGGSNLAAATIWMSDQKPPSGQVQCMGMLF